MGLVLLMVGGMALVVYHYKMANLYRATGKIMVDPASDSAEAGAKEDDFEFWEFQAEVLRSTELLSAARRKLVHLEKSARLPLMVTLEVQPVEGTHLLVVSATSTSSEYSRQYVNAVMEESIACKRAVPEKKTAVLNMLNQEIQRLEKERGAVEEQLRAFKKAHPDVPEKQGKDSEHRRLSICIQGHQEMETLLKKRLEEVAHEEQPKDSRVRIVDSASEAVRTGTTWIRPDPADWESSCVQWEPPLLTDLVNRARFILLCRVDGSRESVRYLLEEPLKIGSGGHLSFKKGDAISVFPLNAKPGRVRANQVVLFISGTMVGSDFDAGDGAGKLGSRVTIMPVLGGVVRTGRADLPLGALKTLIKKEKDWRMSGEKGANIRCTIRTKDKEQGRWLCGSGGHLAKPKCIRDRWRLPE